MRKQRSLYVKDRIAAEEDTSRIFEKNMDVIYL